MPFSFHHNQESHRKEVQMTNIEDTAQLSLQTKARQPAKWQKEASLVSDISPFRASKARQAGL